MTTPSPAYRGVVLAMLLLVYTFNFVDRQILGILAPAIKAELALSDTQLGALGGLAFALLYATMAVPLAWLADRTSRSWVITVSLAVWSGFTALCGWAGGFWSLFWARVGVGVGEAGGVAPSYALIADYFPAHQRGRALAVYSLGIPLGAA
ncbi:MAG: MFS transporter, partial [Sphingomonas sp.]